jgi:hypothetical protein
MGAACARVIAEYEHVIITIAATVHTHFERIDKTDTDAQPTRSGPCLSTRVRQINILSRVTNASVICENADDNPKHEQQGGVSDIGPG